MTAIKSRRMKGVTHVANIGDRKNAEFWLETPKGKRPLGIPKHR
jgi:hypothetical protein